jgi:transcriptional regulator NrdR family protein
LEIIVQCPFCRYTEKINEKWADRRRHCPRCSRLFSVPSLEKLPKAAEVIKTANGKIYVDRSGNTYG